MNTLSHFFGATDLVVMEYDIEIADLDHPRGERIGYAGFIYAEWSDGSRRRLKVASAYAEAELLSLIESLAGTFNESFVSLCDSLTAAASAWPDARPCYGSRAYVANQIESNETDALEEWRDDIPY